MRLSKQERDALKDLENYYCAYADESVHDRAFLRLKERGLVRSEEAIRYTLSDKGRELLNTLNAEKGGKHG